MNAKARKGQRGVTLIELMIVVVVVALLAVIVYPNYREFVMRARRSEAHIALTQVAAAQEKFFSFCSTYTLNLDPGKMIPNEANCNAAGTASTRDSDEKSYTISADPPAAGAGNITNGFLLTATKSPTGKQFDDSKCATIMLASNGAKTAKNGGGTDTSNQCWRK